MRVVFVDLLHLFNDPHGIFSMTAVLRQIGVEVFFVGTRNFQTALTKVCDLKPDLLLYSSFASTIPSYIQFDKLVKEQMPVRSLIGGPGPTYDWPCLAQSTIDAVCLGEGEIAIGEYIKNGFKPVHNIFHPRSTFPTEFCPLVDLNQMPFPDRSAVYKEDSLLRNSPSKQFLSGRGCHYDCTYCFNHQFRDLFKECGPAVRKKSVDYLLAEIKDLMKQYPLSDIVFNDDTFIIDKKWFLEFAERFSKEIRVTYTCNVRANLVDDDIARALKESGCRGVNWSIESGNPFIRNTVLKRGMSQEQILEAARLLTKHQVLFRLGNMVGLPGETFEQMMETVDLNIKVSPRFALANIFVPFPGLALTRYAVEHGLCSEEVVNILPKDYFSRSVMNVQEKEKVCTYKMFCLFPIFVEFPVLFKKKRLRDFLFRLPSALLRVAYEIVYLIRVAGFYTPKASILHKCRMAKRYLLNW